MNGSKWIRKERRLAIYIRDGFACAFCGDTIEDGAQLSLDHIVSRFDGGGNESSNLITCCRQCNSSKGARSLEDFANAVASYLDAGVSGSEIAQAVIAQTQKKVDVRQARQIISSRPDWQKALHSASKRFS